MSARHIVSVVGARPNFMKIAPLARAIAAHNRQHPSTFRHTLVHTGQHYDKAMSASFFERLAIPRPDIDLGVGSGSHATQVGKTMIEFEKVLQDLRPDFVLVVGDVNATLACAVTARKACIPLVHVEAGLRSFDMTMPEEINRIVTDRLSDRLFTTEPSADANLLREGTPPDRIHRTGNVMIDTLDHCRAKAEALDPVAIVAGQRVSPADTGRNRALCAALENSDYALVTLHRPSNVDDPAVLKPIVDVLLDSVAPEMPVLWAIHPRTRQRLETAGLWTHLADHGRLILLHPLDYLEMLRLNLGARVMLTDSGGLQEECCVLGTPCITLRANTERPVTLRENGGLSVLAGNAPDRIRALFAEMKDGPRKPFRPEFWDGHAAERIVAILARS